MKPETKKLKVLLKLKGFGFFFGCNYAITNINDELYLEGIMQSAVF